MGSISAKSERSRRCKDVEFQGKRIVSVSSCKRRKTRQKQGKFGPCGWQKPLAGDERLSLKPSPVWWCLLGKHHRSIWRFVDIAVWEAEGTKAAHLFLQVLILQWFFLGTGSANSIYLFYSQASLL